MRSLRSLFLLIGAFLICASNAHALVGIGAGAFGPIVSDQTLSVTQASVGDLERRLQVLKRKYRAIENSKMKGGKKRAALQDLQRQLDQLERAILQEQKRKAVIHRRLKNGHVANSNNSGQVTVVPRQQDTVSDHLPTFKPHKVKRNSKPGAFAQVNNAGQSPQILPRDAIKKKQSFFA